MSAAAPNCAPESDDVATGASGNGSVRSCPSPTTAHVASAQPANPNRIAPTPITFRTRTLRSAGAVPLSSLTPPRSGDPLFLSVVGARYIVPSSLGDHLHLATPPHSPQCFSRTTSVLVIPTGIARLFLACGLCMPGYAVEESVFDVNSPPTSTLDRGRARATIPRRTSGGSG